MASNDTGSGGGTQLSQLWLVVSDSINEDVQMRLSQVEVRRIVSSSALQVLVSKVCEAFKSTVATVHGTGANVKL